ncbi:hypothetical protein, partial [Streptomyces sp. CB02923]|uniref:hypothetical protein n=1 Tax=Streptomyces sp. CB02923 TaxID=1718985 RepID=UPI001A8DEAEC
MADDGWDAAVVSELGPELASLWDTEERPPVVGGPESAFPDGEGAYGGVYDGAYGGVYEGVYEGGYGGG